MSSLRSRQLQPLFATRVVWFLCGLLLAACSDSGGAAGPGDSAPENSGGGGLSSGGSLSGGGSVVAPPPQGSGGNVPVLVADAGVDAAIALEPDASADFDAAMGEPVDPAGCTVPTSVGSVGSLGGYGRATGGGDQAPVLVSSLEEAQAAVGTYRSAFKAGSASRLVVRYTGSFDFASITDVCAQHGKAARVLEIKEVDNVTFEGASGSSANFGIKVSRARNIIIRNMVMGLLPGGDQSDAISIEGSGTDGDVEHVWIDHNELFSSTKDDCPGAGDTEFDGLIDIKRGARRITVSYNHLHDHQKTGLIGSSDTDTNERYVTFHHNWYDNVVSRTPLQRGGFVHLYSNYFSEISGSGINVRMGGIALIEANYFEHVHNPVTSRYDTQQGFWELRDNHVGDDITWTAGSDVLENADDWQSTAAFPAAEIDYVYEPDDARCVKFAVQASAGATLEL